MGNLSYSNILKQTDIIAIPNKTGNLLVIPSVLNNAWYNVGT